MIGDKFETLRSFQNKTILNEKNINKVQNTVNSTDSNKEMEPVIALFQQFAR